MMLLAVAALASQKLEEVIVTGVRAAQQPAPRFSSMNTAAWDDRLAIWNKPVSYLDASVMFDVTANLTVYAQYERGALCAVGGSVL